jgi:hypothetical protein
MIAQLLRLTPQQVNRQKVKGKSAEFSTFAFLLFTFAFVKRRP